MDRDKGGTELAQALLPQHWAKMRLLAVLPWVIYLALPVSTRLLPVISDQPPQA